VKLCKKKLSTIVNCDMLKLVSITFSKMLFLFIISSLFLLHPAYIYIYIYIDQICTTFVTGCAHDFLSYH